MQTFLSSPDHHHQQQCHQLFKTKNNEQHATNDKYQTLLQTLPIESGTCCFDPLFKYQGFWLPPTPSLKGILFLQDHFKPRSSDIILATSPKCGTTWLKALIFAIVNRAGFDLHLDTHPLLSASPHDLVPFMEAHFYKHQSISALESLPSPRIFATHTPYTLLPNSMQASGCRFVYVCRDPKDAVVSMWHFVNKLVPRHFPKIPLQHMIQSFCKGVSHYGPFWDHALGYWNSSLEFPHKILFLRYEDLKKDPLFSIGRLAEFLGQPFTLEEEENGLVDKIIKLCSFENLSKLEVNKSSNPQFLSKNSDFFRKGIVGDWQNHLTPKMAAILDQIIKEKLDGTGLNLL